MAKNGNFTFLLLELILAHDVTDLSLQLWHLVVRNGDFTFLLLELKLAHEVADLLADLPSPVVTFHGQEWQCYICTVRAHIVR